MPPKPKFSEDEALALALGALAFIVEDTSRLRNFMVTTGADPAAIRNAPNNPQMLQAVLEFMMGDESLLLMFTANRSLPPEDVPRALVVLQQAD